MRPSFGRVQWLSGLLSSNSTSNRCRIGSQKFWFTSNSRLISTSQASTTKSNSDLPPTTKQESEPAERPVALSPSQDPPNSGTVTPVELASSKRRGEWTRHLITTLDPARLDSSCFMDVSGFRNFHVYDAAFPKSPKQSLLNVHYCSNKRAVHLRFPQDTRGFLYFYEETQNPLHSQIRFRVTQDRDPTRSFASGHDLTYGSGYIWSILLANATSKYPALCAMLLRDGLVDDALLVQLQARSGVGRRRKRVMNTLGHPFTMEFNKKELHVVMRVAGQDRAYKTNGPLVSRESVFYEKGSALCRLERSTLPQHAGRRVVVMRLLKILHPPKRCPELPPTDGVSIPAEGELFKSWYRDMDRPGKCGETLRLLYDAPDSVKQVSDWSS